MSLTSRIGSLNGEMHRQQIEVLQQSCKDLEKEVAYYRNRLREECEKNSQLQTSLAEDWYFVKKELHNFITFTGAMTAMQAKESPLLNNIMRFDRKLMEFASVSHKNEYPDDIGERPKGVPSPPRYRRDTMRGHDPSSPEDVAQSTLQEILHLW
jgi:hypothetical protein